MKTFKFIHEVYETEFTVTEETLPDWINHKDYSFFKKLIMDLPINGTIQTDFNTIIRIT